MLFPTRFPHWIGGGECIKSCALHRRFHSLFKRGRDGDRARERVGQRLGQSVDDGRQEFYWVGEQLFRLSVVSSLIKYTQLIMFLIFLSVLYIISPENISFILRSYHRRWKAAHFKPTLGLQPWAGREPYDAATAATVDLDFSVSSGRWPPKLIA